MPEALWLTEADVAGLLDLRDAIDVLADAHRMYGAGRATNMVRTHAKDGPADLHAVGGILGDAAIAGTKTWMHTPGGARPLLVLFSAADGTIRCVIEAFALGQLRTAGTAGLGTRLLARTDADTLALVGTGKQAPAQAMAVHAVRPLRQIRVYGRDPARRTTLCERLSAELPAAVTEHASLEEAMSGADVVTLITRASEPIVGPTLIQPGAHINAVGAIMPARRELDAHAVGRCDVVAVDSLEQARRDSGELRAAVAADQLTWDAVRELGGLLAHGAAPGRRGDGDITLFKALGVGLADVALGAELARRARRAGLGRPLPGAGRPLSDVLNDQPRSTAHV